MSARTRTRPHPATTDGVCSRLPWWALALPVLAFIALLALVLNPADAHAATGTPATVQLLQLIRELFTR
ncbi:hypothetical protein [Streptomyces thermoalcalitolerans]|uniref:Secreted protein n=1 Tax=Streptomyces thermoalcalitolerans TaxID=65605 RepID=A0ABN1NDT4_9ACTN